MSEQELKTSKGAISQPEKVNAKPEKSREEIILEQWVPKTALGQDVVKGKYTSLMDILNKGLLILEPEIVDYLVPDLKEEIIYIGGSPGKGGGIKRTATKITARMHKSGRRFTLSALSVIGNEDGIIGIGKGTALDHRSAIQKSSQQAKLTVIPVKRSCGSWECGCDGSHSIPFEVEAKSGSVKVVLKPAPKGVGIVADKETRKILKLAGISDIWVKTFGQTGTRQNLAYAVFEALRSLSTKKGDL